MVQNGIVFQIFTENKWLSELTAAIHNTVPPFLNSISYFPSVSLPVSVNHNSFVAKQP